MWLLALACATAASSARGTTVPDAISLVADMLVSAQSSVTGNWPRDGSFTYPGVMTAGLADAYLVTGVAAYRNSATKGADAILKAEAGNFYGDEAWGLAMASQINVTPDANAYRTALTTFYTASLPHRNGGTSGYINELISLNERSVALYYLTQHLAAAAYVNAPETGLWRTAVINTLAQVNDTNWFPVMSASIATWALAQTGPLDDTLISSTGFWAGKHLSDLPGMMAAEQITSGSLTGSFNGDFNDTDYQGYTEDAAYGSKGLEVSPTYWPQALAAKTWLANSVLTNGTNSGLYQEQPGVTNSAAHYVYTGKALEGMASAFPATWNGGSGNWSDGTQWNSLQTPNNNPPSGAYFDVTIAAGTVNVDATGAVRLLKVNGGTLTGPGNLAVAAGTVYGNYSVSGTTTVTAGTLLFAGGVNSANLAGSGAAEISSGATLTMGPASISTVANNGSVIFSPAGAMTVSSAFSGGGTLTHGGGGTTTLTGAYAATGPVALPAGTLVFATTAAARGTTGVLLKMQSLTMADGTKSDVTNHDLMIGNTSLAAVEGEILAAYGVGGTASGSISSSTALAQRMTILVPMTAAPGSTFDGVTVTEPGTVLVKYTYVGDLNLDGQVDGTDVAIANSHLGDTTLGEGDFAAALQWGDVTLDGVVNALDLATIAGNYSAGVAPPLGPLSLAAATSVPEPSSLMWLGAASVGLLARRRRRQRLCGHHAT